MSPGNIRKPSPTAQTKLSPLRNLTHYFTMHQPSLHSPLNASTCANSVTGHLRPPLVCGVTSRAIRKSAKHSCTFVALNNWNQITWTISPLNMIYFGTHLQPKPRDLLIAFDHTLSYFYKQYSECILDCMPRVA